jgi:ABC transporter substrate binding protein
VLWDPSHVDNDFTEVQTAARRQNIKLQSLELHGPVDLDTTMQAAAKGRPEQDGAVMTYGPNRIEIAKRLAIYIDKIVKGAKPADLPIEQPTTFELVINLKTAKTLGLTLPPSLLLRADQVIE